MTDIKPCAVKGCWETIYHHHYTPGIPGAFECDSPNSCVGVSWLTFSPVAAPARPTRKALNARIAALEAENSDLFAEIADKKDRLARCEMPADVTWSALNVNADGKAIGFVLAARNRFIGFNYNIENSAAGFKTNLADAVQHVRQTYLAAVEAGEVAVA